MKSKSHWIANLSAVLVFLIFVFDISKAWQNPVDLILDLLGILGILVIWGVAIRKH